MLDSLKIPEAPDAGKTHIVAQVAHHLLPVKATVDGLPQTPVMKGTPRVLHIETQVLGVQIGRGDHIDTRGILLLQRPRRGEDLVFVAGVQRIHEVQIALDKLEEEGLFVDDEGHRHSVEVG